MKALAVLGTFVLAVLWPRAHVLGLTIAGMSFALYLLDQLHDYLTRRN